jgi:hypothetical protein
MKIKKTKQKSLKFRQVVTLSLHEEGHLKVISNTLRSATAVSWFVIKKKMEENHTMCGVWDLWK